MHADTRDLVTVLQCYESLVLYINNYNDPFPGITKVEAGSNMGSLTNHFSRHGALIEENFYT